MGSGDPESKVARHNRLFKTPHVLQRREEEDSNASDSDLVDINTSQPKTRPSRHLFRLPRQLQNNVDDNGSARDSGMQYNSNVDASKLEDVSSSNFWREVVRPRLLFDPEELQSMPEGHGHDNRSELKSASSDDSDVEYVRTNRLLEARKQLQSKKEDSSSSDSDVEYVRTNQIRPASQQLQKKPKQASLNTEDSEPSAAPISPLFRLPQELQNFVFDYAYGSDPDTTIKVFSLKDWEVDESRKRMGDKNYIVRPRPAPKVNEFLISKEFFVSAASAYVRNTNLTSDSQYTPYWELGEILHAFGSSATWEIPGAMWNSKFPRLLKKFGIIVCVGTFDSLALAPKNIWETSFDDAEIVQLKLFKWLAQIKGLTEFKVLPDSESYDPMDPAFVKVWEANVKRFEILLRLEVTKPKNLTKKTSRRAGSIQPLYKGSKVSDPYRPSQSGAPSQLQGVSYSVKKPAVPGIPKAVSAMPEDMSELSWTEIRIKLGEVFTLLQELGIPPNERRPILSDVSIRSFEQRLRRKGTLGDAPDEEKVDVVMAGKAPNDSIARGVFATGRRHKRAQARGKNLSQIKAPEIKASDVKAIPRGGVVEPAPGRSDVRNKVFEHRFKGKKIWGARQVPVEKKNIFMTETAPKDLIARPVAATGGQLRGSQYRRPQGFPEVDEIRAIIPPALGQTAITMEFLLSVFRIRIAGRVNTFRGLINAIAHREPATGRLFLK